MHAKRLKLLPEMEGRTARWYARVRGTDTQLELYRTQAAQLTHALPRGARVLEVAPGPGYLSLEIARLGFEVAGLDISHSMVDIARGNAQAAGLMVDFRHGDAARIPFEADSFDLLVCQAAFKNFAAPAAALDEMHRVLRSAGAAIIQDLNPEASRADIQQEVTRMRLGRLNAIVTRLILSSVLRRRAYSAHQLERLAVASSFGTCQIRRDGITLEVRLQKRAMQQAA